MFAELITECRYILEAVDKQRFADSIRKLATQKAREALQTKKLSGVRVGGTDSQDRRRKASQSTADYAAALYHAHAKYLRRHGLKGDVGSSRKRAREQTKVAQGESLYYLAKRVIEDRDPVWMRQKGVSTTTAVTQGRDVERSRGGAQSHAFTGGRRGAGIQADPGTIGAFRAAGGRRGKVKIGPRGVVTAANRPRSPVEVHHRVQGTRYGKH